MKLTDQEKSLIQSSLLRHLVRMQQLEESRTELGMSHDMSPKIKELQFLYNRFKAKGETS